MSSPLRQAAWSHAHEGRSFVLVLLPCVLLGAGWLQRRDEMLLWQAVLASRLSLFVELLPVLTLSTLSLAVVNSSACCGSEHLCGPGNPTQQLLCVCLPPCHRAWVRAPGRQTVMGPSMGEEGVV